MDIVLSQLKPKSQAMVNIITSIIGAVILLVITWYAADITWYNFQQGYTNPTWLEPPKWLLLVVVPMGTFLFSIQFLRTAYGYFRRWKAL